MAQLLAGHGTAAVLELLGHREWTYSPWLALEQTLSFAGDEGMQSRAVQGEGDDELEMKGCR